MNLFLFLFVVTSTGILAVFHADTKLEGRTTVLVRKKHERHFAAMRDEALLIIRATPDWPVSILDDWRDVRLFDRGYASKREVYNGGAMALRAHRRHDDLLEWCRRWRADDDRDVSAMACEVEARFRIDPSSADARAALERQWLDFPRNDPSARFFADMLADTGNIARLTALVEEQRAAAVASATAEVWQVFWDDGRGTSEADSIKLLPTRSGDHWRLAVTLPGGVKVLRIDPSEYAMVRIFDLQVRAARGELRPGPAAISVHQMRKAEDALHSIGLIDPYFWFDVRDIVGPDDSQVIISFKLAGDVDPNFQAAQDRANARRTRK